jgi:hypothetical protein
MLPVQRVSVGELWTLLMREGDHVGNASSGAGGSSAISPGVSPGGANGFVVGNGFPTGGSGGSIGPGGGKKMNGKVK